MAKKKKPRISLKLQLIGILAAGLSLFLVIVLVLSAVQNAVNAVIIILESDRVGQYEQYTRSKLAVAPEIVELTGKFKLYMDKAIREYNEGSSYDITAFDANDDPLIYWMVGICAAYTKNWTVNTEHNIMGVRGLPYDCSPDDSILAACRMIVKLYGELALDIDTSYFVPEDFKNDFYLSETTYNYDPAYYPELLPYAFNSEFYFGYPSADGQTYLQMDEDGNQEDLEDDQMASQKMYLFTAAYFYGSTDIRKFWMFKYSSETYNGNGEWVDENGIRHAFWDDEILEEYSNVYTVKQKNDLAAERRLAQLGSKQDLEEYLEYEQSVVFQLDLSLVNMVYKYYDAYNVQINTGQKLCLPVPEAYSWLVAKSALTGYFGYRDAVRTYNEATGQWGWSTGKRYENGQPVPAYPHRGIDIGLDEGYNLIACISGTVTELVNNPGSGEGCHIGITSNDGAYTFRYLHCQESSFTVQNGDTVKQGQVIAKCGSTGPVTGAHLHFEIRDNSDYKNIDPLFILTNGEEKCDYGEDNYYKIAGTDCKIITEVPAWFTSGPEYNSEDVRILASMIACECVGGDFSGGGQPYAGKLGCGIVAQNRLELWGNRYGFESIEDVLLQTLNGVYMFSPAAPSGSLRSALDTYDSGKLDDDCISAAIDALSGTKTVPYNGKNYDFTGFLFYANMPGKDRRGVVVIGGHGYAVWQFWDFSQEPPANAVDQ